MIADGNPGEVRIVSHKPGTKSILIGYVTATLTIGAPPHYRIERFED